MEIMIDTCVNIEADAAIIDDFNKEEFEKLYYIKKEGDGDITIQDDNRKYEEETASYKGMKHIYSEGIYYLNSVTLYL